MSEEPLVVTVETASGAHSSFPVVLKKIMAMPPPNILDGDDEIDKEKQSDVGDLVGGVGDMGPSAALTPAIWDKTIPYDGENFHLEYMDLEEFLMENGIANSMGEDLDMSSSSGVAVKTEPSSSTKPNKAMSTASLMPIQELDKCDEEVVIYTNGETDITCTVTAEVSSDCDSDSDRSSPINPEEVVVEVNYEPDPTDLVLSSVPGGELFDPRKHKFSEEELKPQPMIKKAKKVLVPEEQKDDKYWQRRKKNNVAAKRSRDARRLKENQITVRAAFLERENAALRSEVADLRKECSSYKKTVIGYETKFGKL